MPTSILSRLILAGVFIYASLDKIMNPGAFSQAVFNCQVLPGELVNLTALILPWLELILALGLVGLTYYKKTAHNKNQLYTV